MSTDYATTVDRELETKHRTLWGLGDYGTIAAEVVAPLGPELVAATGIGPGTRVLDVAAGTGNAAIPAALAGAEVVATDLVPDLLAQGQRLAAAAGVGLVWQEANAEALPFGDGEFDTVLSCIGVMFAPHHEQAAAELVRVCRPGGTIGVISWTPEGFIGQMFATMKPFVPAPPPGVSPPPLWGSENHVTALLGDRVTDVVTHEAVPDRGPVHRRGGVPRLLQGQLRSDDHRLPRHRRPTRARRRTRCGAGRTRRPRAGRDVDDGVGIPAGHRARSRLTRSSVDAVAAASASTSFASRVPQTQSQCAATVAPCAGRGASVAPSADRHRTVSSTGSPR